MNGTPRRRITVTSSLIEIYRDHLGNMQDVCNGGKGISPSAPTSFYSRFLDRYLKTP
jgi:hypothetical protein